MRAVLIVSLVLALGGCETVRSGLGAYQKAADKGIGVPGSNVGPVAIGGTTSPPPAPAGTVVENATGSEAPAQAAAQASPALPTGLGGDKAHAAYSSETPKP